MQNKILKIILITSFAMLMVSCAATFTHTSSSKTIKQIRADKLANGKTIMVGYIDTKPEWSCKQVNKLTTAWQYDKFKALTSFSMSPYSYLQKRAIDYANKNHINANYMQLYIPSQSAIEGISLHMGSRATATYYLCKNPPAKNSWF